VGSLTRTTLSGGAGLTGATAAHRLAAGGVHSVVVERRTQVGGLIRSDHLEGILYEPHGTHVFHTDDAEVWALASSVVPFRSYRHRVGIVVDGGLYNWPILVSDLRSQSQGQQMLAELDARRDVDTSGRSAAANFEEWCLTLVGPTVYKRYIHPYTEKQWGRPPSSLPATWAPRRVSVRWDDDPYLFADEFQGWPDSANGYTDLIDGLLCDPHIVVETGVDVTLASIGDLAAAAGADTVLLTCALDEFADGRLGELEWRGIEVRNVYVPHVDHAQATTVVNYPALHFPFIRVHETKHASGQTAKGTVLGFEFTGAPARHYPVETLGNRRLNAQYQSYIADSLGTRNTFFAGRLASYAYMDMDDCMRQAIDVTSRIVLCD